MPSIFISDLHLMPERPDVAWAFHGFLQGKALEAESLYILGDFFEYWIGNDAMSNFHLEIVETLLRYTATGRNVFFMPGNRDFLIDKTFCRKTGINWLNDPALITLDATPILLMHGDSLCTLDTRYILFRKIIRSPLTQWLFNRLPLHVRKQITDKLRARSRDACSAKSVAIMDVAPEAVLDIMQKHQALTLVHGHTHRPDTHTLQLGNTPARRIVLGDWDRNGWYLEFSKGHFNLAHFPIPSL